MDYYWNGRSGRDWDEFDVLPGEEELDETFDLPAPDSFIFEKLDRLERLRKPHAVLKQLAEMMNGLIGRIGPGGYSPANVEAVFRFACQMTRFRRIYVEDICKKDDIFALFFHACYDFVSFSENSPGRNFSETLLIIEAVLDRENLIQKYSAGYFDYSTHYLFVAKLFKDARLKSYFLKALRFYEKVPQEELLLDRETDIENIIDAMGIRRWTEFIPVLTPYLYSSDEVIRYTAVGALGRIGGSDATRLLKSFRREALEGFISMDSYGMSCVDLNVVLASKGPRGVAEYASGNVSLDTVRIAIRMLAGIRNPAVIRFLFSMLDDERFLEEEVHYVSDRESYIRQEFHFPLKEEAMLALEVYREDYITSVLGDRYIFRRDYFYSELERLYQKKGLPRFWEDDQSD